MATADNWSFEVTKIKRLHDGRLLAGAGNFSFVLAMYDWIESGANPATFPGHQGDKYDWEPILVVNPDGRLIRYERTPHPIEIKSPFYAQGSGRDYALMAMHLGRSAPEAVKLASELDPYTGGGVDTLALALTRPDDSWPLAAHLPVSK